MKTRSILLMLFTTLGIFIASNAVSAQTPTQTPNTEPWEEWSVSLPPGTTPEDVLKSINDGWASEKNWTNLNTNGPDNSRLSVWRFTDRTGQAWIATARAEPCEARRGNTLVTLKIVKAAAPCLTSAKGNSALRSPRVAARGPH
jgi:hypothetical protein